MPLNLSPSTSGPAPGSTLPPNPISSPPTDPPTRAPMPTHVTDTLATDVVHTSPQNQPSPQQLASPSAAPSPLPSTLPPLEIASELPVIATSAPLPHPMLTRSQTSSSQPKHFPEFQMYYTSNHPPSTLVLQEPSCYTKAATDSLWKDAMAQEFSALISNGTWTLFPRPTHHHTIRNKSVYKIKRKADGTLDRFKARLVAKGFEQQSGVDYSDTFSPVIKPSTIRIVLALAAQFQWPIKQLDVSNAFLHGSLQDEVYMEQHQGFKDASHPNYVCKLHKAIYGLKQAPRAWFQCLSVTTRFFFFTKHPHNH